MAGSSSNSSGGGGSAAVTGTSAAPSRWNRWGMAAVNKGVQISDWASGYANAGSAKIGGERFWPSSNDMPLEIEKCERILRAFTVEGIPDKAEKEREEEFKDSKGNFMKKKRKVLKKIPPRIIEQAVGIVIYTGMRSGIAPFGGAGGGGLVLQRLPNGQWSAPSAISPNNLSVGLLLGLDIYDCILVIRKPELMKSFGTHKFTLGAETAIAAGPFGAGISAESGIDRAPIFSYVRSRGLYAGVEIMGQAFIDRFDENERFYHWPGVKARDILEGKVHIPPIVLPLHRALRDAETGVAQGGKLEKTVYDLVKIPQNDAVKALSIKKARERKHQKKESNGTSVDSGSGERLSDEKVEGESLNRTGGESDEILISRTSVDENEEREQAQGKDLQKDSDHKILPPPPRHPTARSGNQEDLESDSDEDFLAEGERLRLPPTPQELDALEAAGIPDEEDFLQIKKDREEVYQLEIPPMHPYTKRYLDARPSLSRVYPREKLIMNGRGGPEVRRWRRSLDMVENLAFEDEKEQNEREIEEGRFENDYGEKGDLGEGSTDLMLNHGNRESFSHFGTSVRGSKEQDSNAHSLAQEIERESLERKEIENEGGRIAPTPPVSKTPEIESINSIINDSQTTSSNALLPAFEKVELEPSSSPISPFNTSLPETKEDPKPYPESLTEESQPKRRSLFLPRDSEREEMELLRGTKEEEKEEDLESPQEVRNSSWHQDEDEDDEYSRAAQSRFEKLANSGSLADELARSDEKDDQIGNEDKIVVGETIADPFEEKEKEEDLTDSSLMKEKDENELFQSTSLTTDKIVEDSNSIDEVPKTPPPQEDNREEELDDLKTPLKTQFDQISIPNHDNDSSKPELYSTSSGSHVQIGEEEIEGPDSSRTERAQDEMKEEEKGKESESQLHTHSHSDSVHSIHSSSSIVTSAEESFASAENSRAGSLNGDFDDAINDDGKLEKDQKLVESKHEQEPEKEKGKEEEIPSSSNSSLQKEIEEEKNVELSPTVSDQNQEINSSSIPINQSENEPSSKEEIQSIQGSENENTVPDSTNDLTSVARSPSISSNSSGKNTNTPNGSTRGSVMSITDASLLPPPQRPPRRARGSKGKK